jgi:hypothetical protein
MRASLLLLDPRTVLFLAGDIAVEIFKPKRKPIGHRAIDTAWPSRWGDDDR